MAAPTALGSYRAGLRRLVTAPSVWAGAWTVSLLLAVPLAFALHDMIATHLGASLAAETAASGVNLEWWDEFRSQATGLGTTFVPSILGFAAVLQNLSGLADNDPLPTVVGGVVAAWLVVWSFLAGGFIDRYARDRAVGAAAFFSACGGHFWRLLRLGLIALIAYGFLFGRVHGWLIGNATSDGLYGWLTRDLDTERIAFAWRLLLYGVFVVLLLAVNLVIDYARVRIVVEDRRSAVFALAAGLRFVRRHLAGVLALYGLNTAGFLLVVLLYALVAPAAGTTGWPGWLAFLAGQAYILLRLGVKLGFYASQTAFFQAALAHADYVASPTPEWPESPAAEAARGEAPAAPTSL